jgi:hypothetical protein
MLRLLRPFRTYPYTPKHPNPRDTTTLPAPRSMLAPLTL